jgi:hypothetical protein
MDMTPRRTLLATITIVLLAAIVTLLVIIATQLGQQAEQGDHDRKVAACDQVADRTDIYGPGLKQWTECMEGLNP